MKPKKLVAVEYFDHCYADNEDDAAPIVCRDVGFFVDEKKTESGTPYIVLAAGLDDKGDFNRPFNVILKRTLIKLTEMRE